ncbi:hypothetical protein K504DRAFT_389525 [Pleomassaria siparia CBS 279.74]|uniref:Peptide N-acetyl-beta-D-glucosaminyl asparaginase amidase A N-terminal domain-containing protein n=1 Tax=Pleomassaria siparia CBS 279.74 TaxID=1314801 RepID=A0A6G1JX65_9PLEO|nr:hypothetical protein K504DRAFT_389525 [Pleomassaria siparia CBS 279.74]
MELRGQEGESRPSPAIGNGLLLPFITFFLILITLPQTALAIFTSQQPDLLAPGPALNNRAPIDNSSLLECFQVSAPVASPATPSCQQTLMVHTFGSSYGVPFVGNYTPPDCDFNRVIFNFTVTSAGRQFDRLALMFLNDTEIFRTSTAEPTAKGIIWTYVKDMSSFLLLFKEPQKIIFDLGNNIDDTYTGSWYTTLTATFFAEEDSIDPADVIIPVSAHRSAENSSSAFVVPDSKAINTITLPQNVKKAVFSISACGQAAEEFWWSNVLSSDTNVFAGTTLYGYSPFRELQLLIDGVLAGVAWPFPVIFTGGVVPGFWRPIVGIDAFDLREDEIDISAFLPILCDGKEHTFEIRVAGISDNGNQNGTLTETVGSNWVVTGKVFIWLDSVGIITTGTVPTISTPSPSIGIQSSTETIGNGTVGSLDYSVKVSRSLSISSTVTTSAGSRSVTWKQDLAYSNKGLFTDSGNEQINQQFTSGNDASSSTYTKAFRYPLSVYSAYKVLQGGNFTIVGDMSRGKNVVKTGELAFPSELKTFDYSHSPTQYGSSFTGTSSFDWQNGTASYLGAPALKRSFGSGTTEEYYALSGIGHGAGGTDLYRRHVLAANDTLLLDEQRFGDQAPKKSSAGAQRSDTPTFAWKSAKTMLGHGPA